MASAQDPEDIRNWLEAVRSSGSSCSHPADIADFFMQWYAVGDKCVPSNSIKWFAEDCVVRTCYSLSCRELRHPIGTNQLPEFNNAPPVRGKAVAQNVSIATFSILTIRS